MSSQKRVGAKKKLRALSASTQPAFSEDDYIAHIIEILRQDRTEDIALEEFVRLPGQRGRKDIAVKRNGLLFMLIEVKRPTKFATSQAKRKASVQVTAYAVAEKCDYVGWTDGTHFYSRELSTGIETYGTLIGVASGLFGSTSSQRPTVYRPQWTDEEVYQYPMRQRDLHTNATSRTQYVARSLPFGSIAQIISSPATLHIVYGDSDVGKTTLSRVVAADAAWNAIYLEASLFGADIETCISKEIQTLYGRTPPLQTFIENLQSISLQHLQIPFGVVIDGFEEWPGGPNLGTFATLLQRLNFLRCKVLVFTRTGRMQFFRSPQLASFIPPTGQVQLGELTDEELDRFVNEIFPSRGIGGTLSGSARTICRNPGMFSMVAETYENQASVDPGLTQPELYRRYQEHKGLKLATKHAMTTQQFEIALEQLAMRFLELEQFALSYDDAVACVGGRPELESIVEESILVRIGPAATAPVRFRYSQYRDHALATLSKARGIPSFKLLSGIQAIKKAEGVE